MPRPARRVVAALTSPFALRLAAVVVLGLLVRVAYVLLVAGDREIIGDALSYHLWAEQIADGNGMVTVSHAQAGAVVTDPEPTAELAPLFPHVLGVVHWLGVTSIAGQKLVMAVAGTLTVAFSGLAGREAGRHLDAEDESAAERIGLVAAFCAALYPFLWVVDGSLMSETLYGVWLSLGLWVALRFGRRPSLGGVVAMGALVGLAGLTRGEALALGPLVVVPLCWLAGRDLRQRLGWIVAAGAMAMLVLAPWTIRNLREFEEPVLIANNSNAVFVGANCEPVYYGDTLGLWNFDCYGERPPGDESERALAYRARGFDYARDNIGRLPVVMAARLGRIWELYQPLDQASYEVFEGRPRQVSLLGLVVFYPLVVASVAGIVRLRHRVRALIPLVAPLVVVSVVGVVVYGVTRFRFTAEPSLVVLGAVGAEWAYAAWRSRRVTDISTVSQ